MPAAPIKLTLDDFKFDWDDDEENIILTLSGEDGEEVQVVIEREIAGELTEDMGQFLGIEDDDGDDD